MATLPQPDPNAEQNPQGQPQPAAPEASPRNPVQGKPQDRLAAFFKTQDAGQVRRYEQMLVKIWRRHIEDWAIPRRMKLRDVLRAIEYNKGNQYISWDPFSFAYYNPFAVGSLPGQSEGTQQGTDEANIYQNTANIIQWLRRVWTSYLGGAVPRVEWWPGDSESDLDNRCAQTRGRAYRKISGDNQDKGFLALCLDYLFLTGSYFRTIHWSMDKSITGTHFEPIYQWQEQEVLPNRYICPNCGQSTPANLQTIDSKRPCLSCGAPLTSANFYPAQKIKMPVQTGQREVPNGQVRWNAWNILNMEIMPQSSPQGAGVIGNSPISDLSCLITKGAFRRMYPDAWDKIRSADSDNAGNDAEITRVAQIRALTPGVQRGVVVAPNQLSYHRVWFNPDAIYALDENKEDIKKLADLIGDGCMGVIQENSIIDIKDATATKEITWCGAEQDAGAYPPAPVYPALDFQDRINDRMNGIDEFHDRAGNPPIIYDAFVWGDAMSGKFLPAGALVPVAQSRDINRKLSETCWQPDFHMDNGVYKWVDQLMQFVQMLVGVNPSMYGGGQQHIDTAQGQKQSLDTSRAAQGGHFQAVVNEFAFAANLSVDCFAKNATNDDYLVTKSDDGPDKFSSEPIRIADLSANATARPEANQDYPVDYDQQRELFKELIGMAGGREPNPLVMEVLDTYENRRLAMRYVGPPDLELPEQPARDKVVNDISTIMTAEQPIVPGQAQDPQSGAPIQVDKPIVEPDFDTDIDYLELVSIPTVVRYALKNFKLKREKPQNWQALMLYLQIAREYRDQSKAQPILSQNAPGWQGTLGNPAPKGSGAAPPTPQREGKSKWQPKQSLRS